MRRGNRNANEFVVRISDHEDREGHEDFGNNNLEYLNFMLFANFVVKCLGLPWFACLAAELQSEQ